jgi:hypothetical protein
MAFTSGIATDPLDLSRKLKAFLYDDVNGAGWLPMTGTSLDSFEGAKNLRTNDTASSIYVLFNLNADSYVNAYNYEYYDIEFFEDKTVKSIAISMPDLNAGSTVLTLTYSPIRITLQSSSDGVNWTTCMDETNIPIWSDMDRRVFNLTAPTTARWFRLTFPQARSSNYTTVGEVQFYDNNDDEIIVAQDRHQISIFATSPYVASGVSARLVFSFGLSDQENYYSVRTTAGISHGIATDGVSGVTYISLGYGSSQTYAYLWDAPMPYWFYGTDRYVYCFVKVGSTYRQFGAGYLLPYATPSQWPFPFFVGGENSGIGNTWDNDTTADIRGFTAPGRGGNYLFHPQSNSWVEVSNFYQSNSEQLQTSGYKLWPTALEAISALGVNADDSTYTLLPLVVFHKDNQVFGELQNIYFVSGDTITSEDTITIGGDTYRVFQNVFRTSRYDYCAVKEV